MIEQTKIIFYEYLRGQCRYRVEKDFNIHLEREEYGDIILEEEDVVLPDREYCLLELDWCSFPNCPYTEEEF